MAVAWLFPGQGSQAVGMGHDLYAASPAARRVLDAADQTLGFRLTRLLFEGPAGEVEEASALVKEEMEGAFELDPPLRVEIGVGDNWLEAK